jgi:Purple acid Phosphatase, N-terminal domain
VRAGNGTPPPQQVHVQFGADAATQIAVSWAAAGPAVRPRLRAGLADGGYGLEVPARHRAYTEALTGETVHTYHASLAGLPPDTAFGYQVIHDVCLQDGGFSSYRRDHVPGYRANGYDPYIHGYSRGRQRAWLAAELAAARESGDIDWIVVCMHQVAMSSARMNGADLGIRRELLPLFDAYGVDLVVAGHEHYFERSFPVRGVLPGSYLLTPAPRGSNPAEMDTSDGTVHMIIGGGGHSVPATTSDPDPPLEGILITGVGPGSPRRQRPSVRVTEPAPWSAYRDLATPFGFASFDVAPAEPGGTSSITVTHYGAAAGSRVYAPLDQFVMRKPAGARCGGPRAGQLAWA